MIAKAFTVAEVLIAFFIFLLLAIIPLVALWTERSIDFWLVWGGSDSDCPYWLGLLVTLALPVAFTCNIVTEIARLFL